MPPKTHTTYLLEASPVGGPGALFLPLSYLDLLWLYFQHPVRRLLFYRHRCSTTHFLETLVPGLQKSLSLALQHYLPLSGHLLYPNNTEEKMPVFRYVPGDSVPLAVAVSGDDFDDLVGNHARDADRFYDFVPEMPPVLEEEEYRITPLLSLKVTLFPDQGICIGLANNHAAGDASSIFRFIKAWSTLARHESIDASSSPVFDRSYIKDLLGIDNIWWKVMKNFPYKPPTSSPVPTNRVRATYTLSRADIENLKNAIRAKKPGLSQPSSFVVSMSYVWISLLKSGDMIGEKVENDTIENFIFTVDARGRVDPPVPENYFGNCLGYGIGKIEHGRLTGDEGFVTAVEVVTEDMKNRVNKKNEIFKGADKWMSSFENFAQMRFMGVSGSPRFDLYGVDFGLGRAVKVEVPTIDGESYSVSLCASGGGSGGGLEVGLSLPRERMEAFEAIFCEGLKL